MRARLKNTAKWMAAIAMAATLMFCLAACASGQEASSGESSPSGPTAAEPEPQPDSTQPSGDLGNAVVAYFTGTGDWVEGHRFSQIATAEDVSQWLESL